MESDIEMMVRIKDEIELMEEAIKVIKRPYQVDIDERQDALNHAVTERIEKIKIRRDTLNNLKQSILESWKEEDGATVKLPNGVKVVRSASRSITVLSTRELLEATLDLIGEEDKLPFRVNWDNKILMPLVETGVIHKNLTKIETTYRLAVRKPKT